MPHDYPKEFQWLADLAREVHDLSGFYRNHETAAIYCPNCQVIQAYCPGCGEPLLDVYDEHTHNCENCGVSLTHCGICGHSVQEQLTAPDDLQKPEFWKYCPACGDGVFAVTDMCPHCKVSMATHLDAVYEQTVSRVSNATLEEEMRQEFGTVGKGKTLPSVKKVNMPFKWHYLIYGEPYQFESHFSIEFCIEKLTALQADWHGERRFAVEVLSQFRPNSVLMITERNAKQGDGFLHRANITLMEKFDGQKTHVILVPQPDKSQVMMVLAGLIIIALIVLLSSSWIVLAIGLAAIEVVWSILRRSYKNSQLYWHIRHQLGDDPRGND